MSSPSVILAPEPLTLDFTRPRDAVWHATQAILRSGLFIPTCAVALAWETSAIAGVATQPPTFFAFLFAATWASYRLQSLRPRPGVGWASVALTWSLFAVVAALMPTLPRAMWSASALAAALAWGYTRPTLPGMRRLREFGIAKILILSSVWTIATTLLPLVARPIGDASLALLLLRRFLFMFTLCVMFDVRDYLADGRVGIRTLPVRLGLARSYALMRITLLAFVALVVVGPRISSAGVASGPVEVALLLSALATWAAVETSRRVRSPWFYLGCVDGMMMLQMLLVAVVVVTTRR